ncbi:MAG: tRNA (adenosine(37)-N6)-threonylcarbamoyltransferase complex ATPase subunit type 1 TsaE, partial [Endomicrobia bacterium]|nr:tRNA (adenosine(37)-N6)-threonylcarbamoyltransferase complex ATPase subunit type 1 TsaE [Endomicrobiia bacterium]
MIYTTFSPESTQQVASKTIKQFINNKKYHYIFIFISGDLGSGKTEFVKGIAKGLGFDNKCIKSPSFLFISELNNKKYKLFHLDFYRISEEFVDKVIHDLLEENLTYNKKHKLIICCEWAEKISKIMKNFICNIEGMKCIKVKIINMGLK